MHRRHGDILAWNGEGVARRGSRFVKHHIRRSPLFEWNFLPTPTFLGVGRDVYLVAHKELSVPLRVLDAGAGELAVPSRHLAGRAEAVGGVAVGRILIDCVVCVAEARSSHEGTAGVRGIAGFFFPLDLHLANLGQDRISHRINTETVSIILILTGLCHIDLNRAVGVDGHIFGRKQTVAVTTACRIVRRSTGDVHRSIFGDGDVFLCENAVCFLVGARAIVRHVDSHFGIALDRHIAGGSATIASLDADCGIGTACCFANRECAAAAGCNGDVTAPSTFKATVINGVLSDQHDGDLRLRASHFDAPAVVAVQRQRAGDRIIRGVGAFWVFGAGSSSVFEIITTRLGKILSAVNGNLIGFRVCVCRQRRHGGDGYHCQ